MRQATETCLASLKKSRLQRNYTAANFRHFKWGIIADCEVRVNLKEAINLHNMISKAFSRWQGMRWGGCWCRFMRAHASKNLWLEVHTHMRLRVNLVYGTCALRGVLAGIRPTLVRFSVGPLTLKNTSVTSQFWTKWSIESQLKIFLRSPKPQKFNRDFTLWFKVSFILLAG